MRRTLLAALVAGALVGAAGAAVQAQEPEPTPAPSPTPTVVPVEDAPVYGRTPDGRYAAFWSHRITHDERIAARLADPAGGPDWAVKVFDAEVVQLKQPSRTLADGKVVRRERCAVLGRVRGEDFGWVYGDGRFRRNHTEPQLAQCASRPRPRPQAQLVATISLANPADARVTGTVVWGLMPGARTVTISGTGSADGKVQAADDAFLRLGGADARPVGRVEGGGETVRLGVVHVPRRFAERLAPGSERVDAPAADPAGGPRYAMLAGKTSDGRSCIDGPTRIVDGRYGAPELSLGLFWQRSGGVCRPLEDSIAREFACDWGYGFGGGQGFFGRDLFLERARIERRVQAGVTTIWAQCRDDVERVTLRTPRDVRTLVPSALGHAVLAVYDGDFVDGKLELTAHLRGGGSKTQTFSLGF